MKYTVVLTEESNGSYSALVPGFPECQVQKKTRNDALSALQENMSLFLKKREILQMEIPKQSEEQKKESTPAEYFGTFQNEPVWGDILEQAEKQRT